MSYYQFPSKRAYLQAKKRVGGKDGSVCGDVRTLARVFATMAEIETPIDSGCLFYRVDCDFAYLPEERRFVRRPVSKDSPNVLHPPPFDPHVLDDAITISRKDFEEWLQENSENITSCS